MAPKSGGIVFFQLPFRHAALWANADELLIPQPSGSSAVLGVVYHEVFVAVGGYSGLI